MRSSQFSSTGKSLIGYVRAWQNVLNDVAAKHGLVAFHFNTYIISVLVIFYLQLKHKLPKIKELSSNKAQLPGGLKLGQLIEGFFSFYGKTFESGAHLISVNVGKWEQKNQSGQKQIHFNPEQKRFFN